MSVFMGWFAKPQYRVVLYAPDFKDKYEDIINTILKFDTVLMVFYMDTSKVSERYVVWSDTKDKIEDGLHLSNLLITDSFRPNLSQITQHTYLYTDIESLFTYLSCNLNIEKLN